MPTVQSVTVGTADQAGTITCPVNVLAGSGNLLLVAAIHIESAGDDCSAMTRDGQSLTEHAVIFAGSWARVEMWKLVNPNLGLNTLTATVAGPASDRARLAVWVIEGADQSTPLRAVASASGNLGAASSIDAPGLVTSDLVIDMLTMDSTGHGAIVGGNQLEEYNLSNGVSASFEMAGSAQDGLDGATMSWSWSLNGPFAHLAVAVVAAGVTMQQIRPDADLATTGWATAPLFSKIAEASADGTVISGVAS